MVRHKNRYIVISISENDRDHVKPLDLKSGTLFNAVTDKVQQLFGDFGVAAIRGGFAAKYCNEKTKIAIIRVRHGPHKFVTSSLPFINQLEKKPIVISTIYTGATIRQCFRFLLEYQQKRFHEFAANLKTEEEKNALKEAIMNLDKALTL